MPDHLPFAPDSAVLADVDAVFSRWQQAAPRVTGFPAGRGVVDFTELLARLSTIITRLPVPNNVGDPDTDGAYPIHAKPEEREAITFLADLFRAPPRDRWGYIAGGATEGTEYALHLARTLHPQAMVYHSTATHHAVVNAIGRLGMEHIPIAVDGDGTMDYQDLTDQIRRHRDRPAVVVANIGTAATEAVDDVRRLTQILDDLAVQRRWIHADAAFAGILYAVMDPADRPGIDFADGVNSLVVSGHKFLGVPFPCAGVITRDSHHKALARAGTYTGSPDGPVANSRSALAVLFLWFALRTVGTDGLRDLVRQCQDVATYAHGRLVEIGWPDVRRLPHALTVTMAAPPVDIAARWGLPDDAVLSRIVVVPGMPREHIDAILRDLQAVDESTVPLVPVPRRRGLSRALPRSPRPAAVTAT